MDIPAHSPRPQNLRLSTMRSPIAFAYSTWSPDGNRIASTYVIEGTAAEVRVLDGVHRRRSLGRSRRDHEVEGRR
jgi:hypothetical protein